MESIGVWVAAILTLVVLSAAFGGNRFSQIAFALLVGSAVGYAAAATVRVVLWPRLVLAFRDPAGQWSLWVWLFLGVLLLLRGAKSTSWLSNLPLAYLVAVGVALAMGGAVLGTVMPQLMAVLAGRPRLTPGNWRAGINALLVALGTGGVLFHFAYTGRSESALAQPWGRLVRSWGRLGYAFILVACGALFATAIVSLLSLLASRLEFLLVDWLKLAIH